MPLPHLPPKPACDIGKKHTSIPSPQLETMPLAVVGDCIVVASPDEDESEPKRDLPGNRIKTEVTVRKDPRSPLPWQTETRMQRGSLREPIEIPDSDGELEPPASRRSLDGPGDEDTFETLRGLTSMNQPSIPQNEKPVAEDESGGIVSNPLQSAKSRRIKPVKQMPAAKVPVHRKKIRKAQPDNHGSGQNKRARDSSYPTTPQEPNTKRRAIKPPTLDEHNQFLRSPISNPLTPTAFGPEGMWSLLSKDRGAVANPCLATDEHERSTTSQPDNHKSFPTVESLTSNEAHSLSSQTAKTKEQGMREKHEKAPHQKREERRKHVEDMLFSYSQSGSSEENERLLRDQLVKFVIRQMDLFNLTDDLYELPEDEEKWFDQRITELATNINGTNDQLIRLIEEIQQRVTINMKVICRRSSEQLKTLDALEKDELRMERDELETFCNMFKSQLRVKSEEFKTFHMRMTALQDEKNNLSEKCRNSEKAFEQTKRKLRDEIAESSSRRDHMITILETEKEAITSENEELKEDLVKMADMLTKKTDEKESLQTDLESLKKEYDIIAHQHAEIQGQVDELRQHRTQLEGRIADQRNQFEQFQNEKTTWMAKDHALLDERNGLQGHIATLKKGNSSLNEQLSEEKRCVQQLRDDRSNDEKMREAEKQDLHSKLRSLEETNIALSEDFSKQQKMAGVERNDLNSKIQSLTKKLEDQDLGLQKRNENLEVITEGQAQTNNAIAALLLEGVAYFQKRQQQNQERKRQEEDQRNHPPQVSSSMTMGPPPAPNPFASQYITQNNQSPVQMQPQHNPSTLQFDRPLQQTLPAMTAPQTRVVTANIGRGQQ